MIIRWVHSHSRIEGLSMMNTLLIAVDHLNFMPLRYKLKFSLFLQDQYEKKLGTITGKTSQFAAEI